MWILWASFPWNLTRAPTGRVAGKGQLGRDGPEGLQIKGVLTLGSLDPQIALINLDLFNILFQMDCDEVIEKEGIDENL